jgi:uncharacterized membrane protein YedE/YeeE
VRRAPLVFVVVFGVAFALLGILVASLVGSNLRTAPVPPDQAAREQWMLLVAVAALIVSGALFGAMLRLALSERRDRQNPHE